MSSAATTMAFVTDAESAAVRTFRAVCNELAYPLNVCTSWQSFTVSHVNPEKAETSIDGVALDLLAGVIVERWPNPAPQPLQTRDEIYRQQEFVAAACAALVISRVKIVNRGVLLDMRSLAQRPLTGLLWLQRLGWRTPSVAWSGQNDGTWAALRKPPRNHAASFILTVFGTSEAWYPSLPPYPLSDHLLRSTREFLSSADLDYCSIPISFYNDVPIAYGLATRFPHWIRPDILAPEFARFIRMAPELTPGAETA